MSQLDEGSVTSGVSGDFVDPDFWDGFVQDVLELTVESYRILYKKIRPRLGWKEDTFTINLVDSVRYVIHQQSYPFSVEGQRYIYTPEMKSGEESPDKAVKIDIAMYHWESRSNERIYFAWECKLIVDQARQKKHERLIPEYITKGIVRFIDGLWKYSEDVNDAGMLGYVLYGNPVDIVKAINQAILDPPPTPPPSANTRYRQAILCAQTLSLSDLLKTCDPGPVKDFAIYRSCHQRPFCGRDIWLYHLFLIFDFVPGRGKDTASEYLTS